MADASRTVWVVNHYTAIPELHHQAGRHYHLATHLEHEGWKAVLIGASTTHPVGKQTLPQGVRRRYVAETPSRLTLRAPAYGRNALRRVVNMAWFTLALLVPASTRGLPAPDVIVGSTVHPFAALAASQLARRRRVPFVFEIRDLWPETFISMGVLRRRGIIARALRFVEHVSIRRASLVLSPLPGVGDYLRAHGYPNDFVWVSNGIEAEAQGGVAVPSAKTHNGLVFTYLGAMGWANALPVIIDAFARYVQISGDVNARLRLVGDGSLKPVLRDRAQASAAGSQITVEDAVPQNQVPRIIAESDCLVINFRNLDVYRYGVSPNKIFQYLLGAKPIIFGSPAKNDPVRDSGAGFSVVPDDVEAFAAAMSKVARLTEDERAKLGIQGRAHVLVEYDYRTLALRLAAALERVVGTRPASR